MATSKSHPNPPDHPRTPSHTCSEQIASIFRSSTDSGARALAEREESWKRYVRDLQKNIDLLAASNRDLLFEKKQWAEQKVNTKVALRSKEIVIDNLKGQLREMHTRFDESNQKLLREAYEAKNDRAEDMDRLSTEKRNLLEELEAKRRELERVRREAEERISELSRSNEALKGQLLEKEQETAALLMEKERLEVELKDRVSKLEEDIERWVRIDFGAPVKNENENENGTMQETGTWCRAPFSGKISTASVTVTLAEQDDATLNNIDGIEITEDNDKMTLSQVFKLK